MNTSQNCKYTAIISVLRTHFKEDLNLSRIKLISYFIVALCRVRSINYKKLACSFDACVSEDSSYRRIQRFMASSNFTMKLASCLIYSLLPEKQNIVLTMDRTNWKLGSNNINILMLGVCYKNVAFPLMFKMLNKRGNSSTDERIELIKQYDSWFGLDSVDCLLADREFVGENWIEFLNRNKIRYYIRIRNNFKIYSYQNQKTIPVFWLFNHLKNGTFHNYQKLVNLHNQDCYLSGCKYINKNGKQSFLIIISFNKPDQAQVKYGKRWQVETLFRGLKSSGFDIEKTHVTKIDRLEKLFSLVIIAFVWCYKVGDHIDSNIKKNQFKNHGRRAISIFKYGLDYLAKVFLTTNNNQNINVIQFLSCT